MIEINHVSKAFRGVVALSDVTARIGPGVTALLGPNGAGKSTLMRILVGLTPPTAGSVTVFGRSIRSSRALRSRVSLVPQQDALFESLDGREFVALAARTYGVSDPQQATELALHTVGLAQLESKPVRSYSKGMRQRIKIAAAIVNNPDVLVLDEPLNGLDPIQRLRMTDLFRTMGQQGRSVIVSSHILAEVAELGSEVLVINKGRLAAAGDYRELRRMMDNRPQLVQVGTDDPVEFAAQVLRHRLAVGVGVSADAFTIQTSNIDMLRRDLARVARDNQLRIRSVENLDDDLDSVFRYLTGDRI